MAFAVTGAIVAEVALGDMIFGGILLDHVTAGSFIDAVVSGSLFGTVAEVASGGTLFETFLEEAFGSAWEKLITAAEEVAAPTAEALGVTGGDLARTAETAAAAAKEAGIVPEPAEFAGVPGTPPEAIARTKDAVSAAQAEAGSQTAKAVLAPEVSPISQTPQASYADLLSQGPPWSAQPPIEAVQPPIDARQPTMPDFQFSGDVIDQGPTFNDTARTAAESQKGTVDRFIDWARDPKNRGLIQLISGGLQVAGGAGKALLESSAQERKLAAEREMMMNKTYWDMVNRRRAMGEKPPVLAVRPYYDAQGRPITPPLMHTTGELVYPAPGLISAAMRRA